MLSPNTLGIHNSHRSSAGRPGGVSVRVAPVTYQVILELGIGHFRESEPRRKHTRRNSLGLFFVHKLTCGKRESVS